MGTQIVEAEQVTLDEKDTQQLKDTLRGELVRPSDAGFDDARAVFNGMIDRRPALIARCAGAADVIAAVSFARAKRLPVSVRGGGHNVTGSAICEDGLVIDLSGMKGLRIDPAAGTIRAEPGLTWGEVNHDLQAFALAAAGGYVSTTGVPGLTLGGGLGWLVRKHGLACDNLRSADVVLADGELVHASPTENGDLFWGLRGGGGNFGVVTSFEFDVHRAGVVQAGLLVYPLPAAADVLPFWRDYARSAPEELTSGALLITAPSAPFVPPEARGVPVLALYVVYAGPLDAGEQALRPLREFLPPLLDLVQPMPYDAVQTMADVLWPPGSLNYWKSGFTEDLSKEAFAVLLDFFARAPSPLDSIILEHNGDGAMNRVGEGDTAFGQRGFPFNLLVTALWADPAETDENIGWTRELWEAMRPHTSEAAYLNYVGDEGEERVRLSYGRANYQRLVALKQKYDPTNFFRLNQNIAPGT
jgi:FAD/FMN-containing dehydrogenase